MELMCFVLSSQPVRGLEGLANYGPHLYDQPSLLSIKTGIRYMASCLRLEGVTWIRRL